MKRFKLLLSSSLFILMSCNSTIPDWIKESNHAISPDGKVAIYSSILDENRISVSTLVNSEIGSGSAGVLDIKTLDPTGLELSWLSESTALIEYPADSEIIRQEDSSFFAGRTIKLEYKIKN